MAPDRSNGGRKCRAFVCPTCSTGGIPLYVGAVIYHRAPDVVYPERGLAAYLTPGAVPKAYCQFLP
jgi:hypothetical protein